MGFIILITLKSDFLNGGLYISTLVEKLFIKTYTCTSILDGLVHVYVFIKSFSAEGEI